MSSSSDPEVSPAAQVDALGHAPRLPALGTKVLAAILLAHFTVDLFAGYRPSLQRHLKDIWQLDNFWTAMLAVPGSLMVMFQPLFGLFSDRMRTRAFVVGGVLMAAVGYGVALPLAGLCSPAVGYCLALAGIWIGSAGIAAYHPQGAALSGRASPKRSERAVALFVFGGTAGYAAGLFVPPLFIEGGYVP